MATTKSRWRERLEQISLEKSNRLWWQSGKV